MQGDPRDEATEMSCLITRQHFEKVDGFVRRALAAGARAILGGSPNDDLGHLYYRPTILVDAEPGSEILTEEVFGPVLTIQTFSGEEQAVEMANNTRFGLAATWSPGSGSCRTGQRTDQCRNHLGQLLLRSRSGAPFGGNGKSGIGREGGIYSFDFYCDIKNTVFSPKGWTTKN